MRSGVFGGAFRGPLGVRAPQCDAFEFALAAMRALGAHEAGTLAGLVEDMRGELGDRVVVSEYIWGMLFRERVRCAQCVAVSDHFQTRWYADLNLASNQCETLRDLWVLHLSECDSADGRARCPRACGGLGCMQCFLEREPPVLVLRLLRGVQEWVRPRGAARGPGRLLSEYKIARRVRFPEVIDFMRTGPYHFAGAVVHHGGVLTSGHYTSACWLGGDRYASFDDIPAARATPLGWGTLSGAITQKGVYVLVYVRQAFWDGRERTGVEDTPYARDATSQEIGRVAARAAPESLVPSLQGSLAGDGAVDFVAAASARLGPPPSSVHRQALGAMQVPDVVASSRVGRAAPAHPSPPVVWRADEMAWVGVPVVFVPLRGAFPLRSAGVSGSPTVAPCVADPLLCEATSPQREDDRGESSAEEVVMDSAPAGSSLAVPAVEVGRRGVVQPVEMWRMFTPPLVDASRCLARTWGAGQGGQCVRRHLAGGRLCAMHAAKQGGGQWLGEVTGEIPGPKLSEFQRVARRRGTSVDSGQASGVIAAGEPGAEVGAGARVRRAATDISRAASVGGARAPSHASPTADIDVAPSRPQDDVQGAPPRVEQGCRLKRRRCAGGAGDVETAVRVVGEQAEAEGSARGAWRPGQVVSLESRDVLVDEQRADAAATLRGVRRREEAEGPARGAWRPGQVVSLQSRDVLGDEQRADAAATLRGVQRREEGERGRMTGFDGQDLDRGEGGAWSAGRQS